MPRTPLADRAEHHAGETASSAASHYEKVGITGELDQDSGRLALHHEGAYGNRGRPFGSQPLERVVQRRLGPRRGLFEDGRLVLRADVDPGEPGVVHEHRVDLAAGALGFLDRPRQCSQRFR